MVLDFPDEHVEDGCSCRMPRTSYSFYCKVALNTRDLMVQTAIETYPSAQSKAVPCDMVFLPEEGKKIAQGRGKKT